MLPRFSAVGAGIVLGASMLGGRIASIVIIVDEGNDVGRSGFAFIDNIRVNDKVFTSSSD